jgi:hypothetical protein
LSSALETTVEYQLLARASGFLEAARIVSDAKDGKTSLVAPIAHLVAHGLEVLMKHWLLRNGVSVGALSSRQYGHQLTVLWNDPKCQNLRQAAEQEGAQALAVAEASGRFLDEDWPKPKALLDEQIEALSKLHTAESNYALRYAAALNSTAPVPLFLLDVFQPLKDRLAGAYSRQDLKL